jgi:KaiC/GvpD/RAD55 family RecA-like ATPase
MDGTDVSDYLVGNRQDELRTIHKLSTANKSGKFVNAEDCERYANMLVTPKISTGIQSLDDMLCGGFETPSLTLLAGYTGIGKSALTQMIAVNVAKAGSKVMYLAGEMTPKQTLDRLVRQWYGGFIRKEDLVDCYKEVASKVLITKFTDITLANVTDTIEEAVLDHGVRFVIVDVLSDVDGFLQDNVMPARIIKAIHKVAKGHSELPSCAVFAVAHTKGSDEGKVRMDSIRGGTAIRQEATCILGFSEEEPGNKKVTNRVINIFKQREVSDSDPITEITLQYDRRSQQYTDHCTYNHTHNTPAKQQHGIQQTPLQDGNHVRLVARGIVPPSEPIPSVPPEAEVHVHTDEEPSTLRVPTPTTMPEPTSTKPLSEFAKRIQSRLLQRREESICRDQGDTKGTGQTKVTASSQDEPVVPVHARPSTDLRNESRGIADSIERTQQLHPEWSDELVALNRMYQAHPDTLDKHRTTLYKTNDLIRNNLIALGIETR